MTKVLKRLLRALLRLLYRVEVRGMEHYRAAGRRVLIVANHVSLLDGLLLYAWLPETPTFAVNTQIAGRPLFRPFLAFVDLFQMDATSPLAVKSLVRFIRDDRKAVVFPEGRITVTGIPMKVYEGPGLVADKADAAILPIGISGPQFSPFSYMHGQARVVWFPKITLTVLPPERIDIDPTVVHGHARRKAAGLAMQRLMLRLFLSTWDFRTTVFRALIEAGRRHGMNRVILEDVNREPLTYRQLIARALILSSVLEKETLPGERVGVLLPNAAVTAVVFMSLQYLGRVPAMLNYIAGAQSILRACEIGQVKSVYTSRKFVAAAQLEDVVSELASGVRVVYLEDLRQAISTLDRLRGLAASFAAERRYRRACPAAVPDSESVLLFTSGSEGNPKGVLLSHANLLSNYAQVRCHIDFRQTDLMFSCLPLFHAFGLNAGLLMPLLGGSRAFLYPTPLHYRIIPEMIYELGVTLLFGTNTFLKGYARHAHPFDFHTLRYVVAGAEKLRDETQRIWMEKFGIRILQGYGVTEASPVVAVNTPLNHRLGTVGQLLPGMESYLQPVEGIADGGRLVVKGPNIMLGYLLHGQAGRQPPGTDRGEGWYDTGDIATQDADGFVTILGRARRFAKIGGEMISLAAVEELAVRTWPDFQHAAVSLPDEKKGEKIVLVTENRDATRREIQETARQLKFSELYIPRKVVLTEELPFLSTGKVDYVTLHELALAEDREGLGWVRKITRLVAPAERRNPGGSAEEDEESGD